MDKLQSAFEDFKKSGFNTVEDIIKWMQSAQVMDSSKMAESDALKMFKAPSNKAAVEFEKLRTVMEQMAVKKKMNVEEIANKLADPKVKQVVQSAINKVHVRIDGSDVTLERTERKKKKDSKNKKTKDSKNKKSKPKKGN